MISVIVPVHNAEAFLPECIASLRAQTLGDLELIFVDDASTDGSAAILECAAAQDPRIHLLRFAQNRGVSAARNAGLEAAAGAYIGFCDADDWCEPEMFEALHRACEDYGAELSFCRVYKDRPSGQENVPLGYPTGTTFDRVQIREALLPSMLALPADGEGLPLSGYTPRNLFCARLAKAHRFAEDIHYAEDLLFIAQCLMDAQRAVALDVAYYHYRFHGESVTKRYSPHLPESLERSDAALSELLQDCAACRARMPIRRRKTVLEAVRNEANAPRPFSERVRRIRAYIRQPEIRALYRSAPGAGLGLRMRLNFFLMRRGWAGALAALYGCVYRNRF